MPPDTPSSTRRLAYGRREGSLTSADDAGRAPARPGRSLRRTTAGDDAIVDVALGQLLERARRELLVARRGAAGELVQGPRILRRHEDAEVLVGGVIGDLDRCEDSHVSDQGVEFSISCSSRSMSSPTWRVRFLTRSRLTVSASMIDSTLETARSRSSLTTTYSYSATCCSS